MCDIITLMRKHLSNKLIEFANTLNKPLYVVGGAVRNFLICKNKVNIKSIFEDIDLSAGIPVDEFSVAINSFGFKIVSEYKHTGTVVFIDEDKKYEYTAFRREVYDGGEHTPKATEFTEDIIEDARRRDFKCNAVYYDICKDKYVDPVGGVNDIENKVLDTVISPEQVFKNDGLRLMRLARFSGELNFKPTESVLQTALTFADNINKVSCERIYAELKKILVADQKYDFSDKNGHYTSLKILDKTRVLDRIFPELTEGRGMVQRADFHKYDVLEHSLRSVLYAHTSVRMDALLHDIGKPYCMKRDGWYYAHFIEGVKIAEKALKRLKADNETIKRVSFIIKNHMVDIDCSMGYGKVRKFIVENYYGYYKELMLVKQADYRASLEDEFVAPTLVKWRKLLEEMKVDGTPFLLKQLQITASQLKEIGYYGKDIGKELKKLHYLAIKNPKNNNKEYLLKIAKSDTNKINRRKK